MNNDRERSPAVSVIMPAWEAELTVGAAVSSVLWQTYQDLELVVVDDGSSDATAAIVGAFGDKVRLLHQEHAGLPTARNHGMAESRGRLITFCDADDLLFPDHIAALVAGLEGGSDIATSNAWFFFPGGIDGRRTLRKGRFPAPERQRRAILEQNFVSIMALFPREMIDEIGPFEDGFEGAEDWEFWIRAVFAGHRVSCQAKPTALYRWGTTSMSSNLERTDTSVLAVLERVRSRSDLTADERRYVERRLRGPDPRQQARLGDVALRAGQYRDAARFYRSAARACPSEQALARKALVTSIAPRLVGPLVRARQLGIEQSMGLSKDHLR